MSSLAPLRFSGLRLRRMEQHLCLMVFLAGAATVRAQQVVIPPSILIPNYDRVFPGLIEALEAGAVTARARNAPAIAYNPAGIALSDRTVLNASAQGYQLTALGGSGFNHATPVSSFEAIPSFLGIVLGREVIDWEAVRLGFAVVTPVHWNQSVVATTAPEANQRTSYTARSSLSTVVPTVAVGWAVSSSVRLGASIEFPYTSLFDLGQLSGELTTPTMSQSIVRNISASGSTLDVNGVVGAQWTAFRWLQLGLLVRSPGLKLLSTGSVQYESLDALAAGTRHTYFYDGSARFEFRSPLVVSGAAALEFGPVQLEVDLRWHDGTHTYQLFSSSQDGRAVDTSSGTPVVSSFPFAGIPYRARQVWNGSLGSRVLLGPRVSLSAGVYLDTSPVDILGEGFRRVDMVGFRTGVAFVAGSVGASLGVGWEHGKAVEDLAPNGFTPSPQDQLSLDTFSIFFSVAFKF